MQCNVWQKRLSFIVRQKLGRQFFILVPKHWEWNFSFLSHSQKLGVLFLIPAPDPKIWPIPIFIPNVPDVPSNQPRNVLCQYHAPPTTCKWMIKESDPTTITLHKDWPQLGAKRFHKGCCIFSSFSRVKIFIRGHTFIKWSETVRCWYTHRNFQSVLIALLQYLKQDLSSQRRQPYSCAPKIKHHSWGGCLISSLNMQIADNYKD